MIVIVVVQFFTYICECKLVRVRNVCCQRRNNRCSVRSPVGPVSLSLSLLLFSNRNHPSFFLFCALVRSSCVRICLVGDNEDDDEGGGIFLPLPSSYVKRKTRDVDEQRSPLSRLVSLITKFFSPDRHISALDKVP